MSPTSFDMTDAPDTSVSLVATLPLIPRYINRFESLTEGFKDGRVDLAIARDIEPFCADFFLAWSINSGAVLRLFGADKVFEIFEFLAGHRAACWDVSLVNHYMELPERIRVFRAGTGSLDEISKGISWWRYRASAEQSTGNQPNRMLVSAEIDKNDILYFDERMDEVVPRLGALIDPQIVS